MEDFLKKMFYQGLGLVAITKDKAEKLVDELIAKGKISEDEGKKFYDELTTEGKKTADDFSKGMKDFVREQIEKSGIPSREEFDAMKLRIVALESQMKEPQA